MISFLLFSTIGLALGIGIRAFSAGGLGSQVITFLVILIIVTPVLLAWKASLESISYSASLFGGAGTPIWAPCEYFGKISYEPDKNEFKIEETVLVDDRLEEAIITNAILYEHYDLSDLKEQARLFTLNLTYETLLNAATTQAEEPEYDRFPHALREMFLQNGHFLSRKTFIVENYDEEARSWFVMDLEKHNAYSVRRSDGEINVYKSELPQFERPQDFMSDLGWVFKGELKKKLRFTRKPKYQKATISKRSVFTIITFPLSLPQYESEREEEDDGSAWRATREILEPDNSSHIILEVPKGMVLETFPPGTHSDTLHDRIVRIRIPVGTNISETDDVYGEVRVKFLNPVLRNPIGRKIVGKSWWTPVQWIVMGVCAIFSEQIKSGILVPIVKNLFSVVGLPFFEG